VKLITEMHYSELIQFESLESVIEIKDADVIARAKQFSVIIKVYLLSVTMAPVNPI